MLSAASHIKPTQAREILKHVKRKGLRTREILKVASLFWLEGPKTWEMLNMLNENRTEHGKC